MPYMVKIIALATMEIIPATMGLMFYYFLFRLIFLRSPSKPKEIQPDEHVYYPLRIYIPVLKIVIGYIVFIIILVSFQLWRMGYLEKGWNAVIICLTCGLIASFLPCEKKVKRVIVNAEGMTLEYRGGGLARYEPKLYLSNDGKCLYFEDQNGIRKTVKLRFLCRDDRNAVIQDLNALKQTGKLTPVAGSKAQEKEWDAIEEWRKANQQFLEEKQKLYADPGRYEAYLKEEAAKRLTPSQKQELVRMIQMGDKMNAIKHCREWTGLGLKEAKDMVDQHRKCLQETGAVTAPETSAVMASDNMTDRLKTDAEIRELDRKRGEEAQQWEKLQENPAQYDAFLREVAKQISESRRQEIVQLAQRGDMVAAIKLFRNTTGQSLKVSHDLVVAYQTYLAADDQRKATPVIEKGFAWKWRITGREQEYSEQKSLESTMDQLLSDLSMRREESIELIPLAPILGIACVRAGLDPHGIMYRAEVEFVEHDAQGNPKILYKDGLMSWDVRDVFVGFRRSGKIRTEGWQQMRSK